MPAAMVLAIALGMSSAASAPPSPSRDDGRPGPGGAAAATAPGDVDDGAHRARAGDFDARTRVPCAQERGEAMGECEAAVARGAVGATVVVRFPNGFARTLRFARGRFVSANATMSGSGSDHDWREADGRHLVRVDDQRYELPVAFVSGP